MGVVKAGMRLVLLVAAVTVLSVGQGRAQERITVTEGTAEAMRIAVTPFRGSGLEETRLAQQIGEVLKADLERSGLFHLIDETAFGPLPESTDVVPKFANWRAIDAETMVVGQLDSEPNGQLRLSFRVWNVFVGDEMLGLAFFGGPDSWRRMAHKAADAIYERLTGEQGYFDTRLAYVAESGPRNNRTYRLAVMDQDGANHRHITDGRTWVFSPRFSPSSSEITYLSFRDSTPRVYLMNLDTAELEVLGDFDGMSFAPRFSPDGNTVLMSYSLEGNIDLFAMDLRTRDSRRLTGNPDIDVSPSFSPDASKIVFQSDRSGSPQLYVMDAAGEWGGGAQAKRISFGKGAYSAPVWSPRGDLIAFIKQTGGKFYIGVMRTDGTQERLLASGYHVDSPTWSSNGRVLIFARQSIDGSEGDRVRLFSIDLTGYNEREIPTPGDASDPAWSYLIR